MIRIVFIIFGLKLGVFFIVVFVNVSDVIYMFKGVREDNMRGYFK